MLPERRIIMNRILVGVDGSQSATRALNWAIGAAEVTGAKLLLAFTGEGPRAELERQLAEWVEPAASVGGPYSLITLEGDARTVLGQLAEQENADLIVVGAGMASWFPALHLGSVSHHLAQHSHRPVCIVPSNTEAFDADRVIVGLDGSSGSQAAAEWACNLARQASSTVFGVHAFEPVISRISKTPPDVALAAERMVHEWTAIFEDAEIPTEELVETEGDPACLLTSATERSQAGLVVVGTRGAGGFHELRLGSVALHLLQHAAVPTVLVPPTHD
jgi:nucleotide-binding universal stress UspA family protein